MRSFSFMLMVALVTVCTAPAFAQRGGGGGGCRRGGPTSMPPSTGVPSVITAIPTEGNISMAGRLGSMSNETATRMQQAYWQQMQQAYLADRVQQVQKEQDDAAAEKRERKIAALKQRREAELARRAAAREKLAQKTGAARK